LAGVIVAGMVAGAAAGAPGGAQDTGGRPVVYELEIDGAITPLTARYLAQGVAEAAEFGAAAVLLRLDTPGGLESAMREMVRVILGAPVPVIVHVAPPGAHAASAGLFITIAAHAAAMAPGTTIGAAHPVSIGGTAGGDTVALEKVVSDAAALARAIASERGRNEAWVEAAVRRSVSVTAAEALELGVIDVVAADRDRLLAALHGRPVRTARGATALRLEGARIVRRTPSLAARALEALVDPNVAYILFTLGVIGLIAELYNPGMLFPGVTGAISLVLAFVAFGGLPVNWAGVALLLLGIGLLVVELYTEGFGFAGIGGVAAFLLGSLLLYSPLTPVSPALPAARVSPWLVALVTGVMVVFLALVARALLRLRRKPVASGAEQLVGRTGRARSRLDPRGTVRVDTEDWSALAEDGPIEPGAAVEVVGVEGVTLRVRPARP